MEDYQDPFDEPNTPPKQGGVPGKGSFELGECLGVGWKATTQNLGTILGALIVSSILIILATFTIIGIFLAVPAILWGQTRFLLNTLDGKCDFEDIFSGFRRYGEILRKTLFLMILMALTAMIGSLVSYAGMFMENIEVQLFGNLISFAWSLLIMVRLYWSFFFLVDQDMGAEESLKASWQASSGNWLNLVLLALLSFVVYLAGMLALCIGLFVAVPVVYLMFASSYRQVVGSPNKVLADEWD